MLISKITTDALVTTTHWFELHIKSDGKHKTQNTELLPGGGGIYSDLNPGGGGSAEYGGGASCALGVPDRNRV